MVHAGTVYSIVDARIRAFSVRERRSWCLPFEAECSIVRIFISPDGKLLAAVDARGLATLLSAKSGQIIQRDVFDIRPIQTLVFSHDSEFIALATPDDVRMYRTNIPDIQTGKSSAFCASLVMRRDTSAVQTLKLSHDDTTLFCLKKDGALLALPVGLVTQRTNIRTASRAKQLKKMFPQEPVEVVVPEQIIDFFPRLNRNVNVFELADSLCGHTLTPEQLETINAQFSERRMFTSDLVVVGRSGRVAIFEAGGAASEEEETQNCYGYVQIDDFQVRRSDDAFAENSEARDVIVTAADLDERHGQLAVCTAAGEYVLYEMAYSQFVHAVSCTPYPLTAVKILSDS